MPAEKSERFMNAKAEEHPGAIRVALGELQQALDTAYGELQELMENHLKLVCKPEAKAVVPGSDVARPNNISPLAEKLLACQAKAQQLRTLISLAHGSLDL